MDFGTGVQIFIAFMFILAAVDFITGAIKGRKAKQNKTINNINEDMMNQQNMQIMQEETDRFIQEADKFAQEEAMKSVTPFEMGGYDTSNQMNDINNSMNNFNNF